MSGAVVDRDDLRHLRRALRLARRGRYGAPPNPMVGTVLVRDGRVVGEGWHEHDGGPHAEVSALAAAAAAGEAVRGATAYVSLEPCAHQGRTPPCAEALVAAGIARVVVVHRDPDPRVAGGGLELLRRNGVEVALLTDLLQDPGGSGATAAGGDAAADDAATDHGAPRDLAGADQTRAARELVADALRLNLHFLIPTVLGRPAVTLKWAMSLDGRIATAGGDSQWISSPPGRRWSLDLRERHDAILVGSGTALADDPRLDRRLGLRPGPITRVFLDRRLRLPATARSLASEGPVLVYTAVGAEAAKIRALEAAGAEVIPLAEAGLSGESAPEMPSAVLADLGRRGVRSLLIEGGGEVAAAWVAAGLYDRVHASVAPLLIAGRQAAGPLAGVGFDPLAAAPRLAHLRVRRRGADAILTALRRECLPELLSSVGAS